VCLYLLITLNDIHDIFNWLFLSSYVLQRIPIIILVLLIITTRSTNDGPTTQSKIFLGLAAGFNLVNDLPLTMWARFLPETCIFVIASYVDLIHLLYLFSLIFFFLFLRSEYLRNMEECIWDTVSQIQDTFDFRRFDT